MYANFRSELITQLGALDRETAAFIIAKFDIVAQNYDITPRSNALTVFEDQNNRVLELFLATMKLEGKSAKSIKRYRFIINKMLDYIGLQYDAIQTNMIRSYLAYKSQTCTNTTVNGERAIISSFFNWLFNESMIARNPVGSISKIKTQKKVKKAFSKTDLEKIRSACTAGRDRAMVEFMLSTGCRVEEMTSIKVEDVDFIKNEIIILGKGNKERILYFNEVASHYLIKYVEARPESEYLFPNRMGGRRTTDSVRKLLKEIESRTDVTDIHPHRFRTTFATDKYKSGMNIFDIAVLMGHENIATTQCYICADNTHIKSEYLSRS